jgi:hypothetical protein
MVPTPCHICVACYGRALCFLLLLPKQTMQTESNPDNMVQWANRCLRPLLAAATLCVLWGAFLCAKIHVNTEDVIFLAAESPASNSSTELNFADTFLALNSSMTSFHSNQHHHQINFVASSMVVEAADVPAALEPKVFLSFSVFQVFAFRGIFFSSAPLTCCCSSLAPPIPLPQSSKRQIHRICWVQAAARRLGWLFRHVLAMWLGCLRNARAPLPLRRRRRRSSLLPTRCVHELFV